jgi:hypothetical protein
MDMYISMYICIYMIYDMYIYTYIYTYLYKHILLNIYIICIYIINIFTCSGNNCSHLINSAFSDAVILLVSGGDDHNEDGIYLQKLQQKHSNLYSMQTSQKGVST